MQIENPAGLAALGANQFQPVSATAQLIHRFEACWDIEKNDYVNIALT